MIELLQWTGTALALATALGYAAPLGWPFELFVHFRGHYAVGLALVSLAMIGIGMWREAVVFGLFVLPNLVAVAPYVRSERARAARPLTTPREHEPATFRLLHHNMLKVNRRYDDLRAMIQEVDPDVITLIELQPPWVEELEHVLARYPYHLHEARRDSYGILLASRLPLSSPEIVRPGVVGAPTITTRLLFEGRTLRLWATHPANPTWWWKHRQRNAQIRDLRDLVNAERGPRLVVGDWNITPWTRFFQQFLRETGFRDSGEGWGWQATWPAWARNGGIPIDHLVHSPDLEVVHRSIGAHSGSDHRSLIVDLKYAAGD